MEQNPAAAQRECQEMAASLDQLVENVRRLSRDLTPTFLQDLGLAAALQRLIKEFAQRHQIQVDCDLPPDLGQMLPREARINIYRIIQESLTNIGKYARAARVTIKVTPEPGRISFRLADDGQGFDVPEAESRELTRRGLGLAAMKERARMLGGTLEINSQKGQGTEILLAVPIPAGEAVANK